MSKKRIGFAGVGRMGTPMVRRLLDAGYEVSVFDVNKDAVASLEKAGSRVAATPAALMGMADMVLMSLPTPEIVQAVALGEEGLVKGKGARIVVDLSTTGPRVMRIVAAGLRAAGITPVDCPVSGGVGGAEKGTLAIMVACASAVLPEVFPVLEVLGKPTHIGEEPWMGQMLKVINNIISVTSLAIASEALVLGAKAGLDPKVMMDVINAGTAGPTRQPTRFRNSSSPAASILASPLAFLPRTYGSASRRATRTGCRWWSGLRCGSSSTSPRGALDPMPT